MKAKVPCVVVAVVAAVVLAGVLSVESVVVSVLNVPVLVVSGAVGKGFMLGEVAERPY